MRNFYLSLVLFAALCRTQVVYAQTVELLSKRAAATCKPIIGQYYTSYSKQDVSTLLTGGTSHAVYFAFETTAAGGIAIPADASDGHVQAFVDRMHAKGKRALMAIGGWGASRYFSSSLSTSTGRTKFIKSILNATTTFGFDGIDLDWEYPNRQGIGNNTISPNDTSYLLALVKALKPALGSKRFLTASFPAQGVNGPGGSPLTDMSAYVPYLDYVTIMSYDFYGNPWSKTTGPNAPLYSCQAGTASVDDSVKFWLNSGFPACKLLLGLATYSHMFKTYSTYLHTTRYNGASTQAFQPVASVQPTDPSYTFNNLIALGWLDSTGATGGSGFVRYWDNCTQTPFLFNKAGNKKIWITYDDVQSIQAKARYAKAQGLGGVMFYESSALTQRALNVAKSGLADVIAVRRIRSKRMDVQPEPVDLFEDFDQEYEEEEEFSIEYPPM